MSGIRHIALLITVLGSFLPSNNCDQLDRSIASKTTELLQLDKIENMVKFASEIIDMKLSKKALLSMGTEFYIEHLLQFPNEISPTCVADVKYFLSELVSVENGQIKAWPIQMLDSMGKPPSGALTGNLYWLGKYQQCLDIEVRNRTAIGTNPNPIFFGEYCLVHFEPTSKKAIEGIQEYFHFAIKVGLCFPSSCSFDDKYRLMNYTFEHFKGELKVDLSRNYCSKKLKQPMDTTTIVFIIIIGIFGMLVLLATMLELMIQQKIIQKNKRNINEEDIGLGMALLTSFSAIKSLKAIFQLKENASELGAIHGIRVLSMFLVVSGHVGLAATKPYPWKNQLEVLYSFDYFFLQPFMFNATYAVTTFFVISGFLVTYIFMGQLTSRHGKTNILGYLIYRYLRLTPPYIITILFLAGPFYYMNDGPVWPQIKDQVAVCRSDWWKNILYIQNIWSIGPNCLEPSWYLSSDTQLYCFAPIVLYPLYRKPFVGIILLGIFFVTSTMASMIFIGVNQYQTFNGKNTNIATFDGYYEDLYYKTYYHISSYAIGMIAGYFLHICQKENVSLTKKITYPCWILAMSIIISISYGTYPYFNGASTMSPFVNIMYGALGRPAWALAVSWIIWACARGHGGIINGFLSLPFFVPLGRLTYSAYLTHYLVLSYYFLGQQDGLYFSIYNMALVVISNLIVTMLAAIVLAVLIEMPVIDMLKQLAKTYDQSSNVIRNKQLTFSTGENEKQYDKCMLLEEGESEDEYEYGKK